MRLPTTAGFSAFRSGLMFDGFAIHTFYLLSQEEKHQPLYALQLVQRPFRFSPGEVLHRAVVMGENVLKFGLGLDSQGHRGSRIQQGKAYVKV